MPTHESRLDALADMRFEQLVRRSGKNIQQYVLDLIVKNHFNRMGSVGTPFQAGELYELVEQTPHTDTLIGLAGDVVLDGVLNQHSSSR